MTTDDDAARRATAYSRAIAGVRWTALSRIAIQVVTWTTTLLVVRLLEPSDFGLATLAAVIAGYFALFGEMGFTATLVQRQTTDDTTLSYVFGALLVLGLALFLGMQLVAPAVAAFFEEPDLVLLTRVAGAQFLLLPFSVLPQARLSIELRFKALGACSLAAAAIGALTTLVLAYRGAGPLAMLLGTLASATTRTLAMNALAPIRVLPKLGLGPLRDFIDFSKYVLASRSVWYWYAEADTLLVGAIFGSAVLGVYAVAKDLAAILSDRLSEIVNAVALPVASSIKNDRHAMRTGYLRVVRLLGYLVFPAFVGFALVADAMVPIVLGSNWVAAVLTFQLLCVAFPLRVLSTLSTPFATAIGQPQMTLQIVLVTAAVMPAAMWFASRWGPEAVAATWPIVFPWLFAYGAYRVSKALELSFTTYLRQLLGPVLATIGMAAVVWPVQSYVFSPALPPVAVLVLSVLLGVGTYAVIVALARPADFRAIIGLARSIVGGR